MDVPYPTDPKMLNAWGNEQWNDLLESLLHMQLPLPRPLVRVVPVKRVVMREAILADCAAGMRGIDIAKKHSVSVSFVSRVKNGTR
jgi:hypothetical protein